MDVFRERFNAKILKCPMSGCWLWTGACNYAEYGQFRFNGRRVTASRVAWVFFRGPLVDNDCVLHHCDVPSCVNPTHLFLGSKADNTADMVAKGRHGRHRQPESAPRGQRAGNAKLTEDAVREIRRLRADGGTYKAIAERYDVNLSAIAKVVYGESWRHVTPLVTFAAPTRAFPSVPP